MYFDTFYRSPTMAEYVSTSHTHVAVAPSNINLSEAGSLPLVALTGYQALHSHGRLALPEDRKADDSSTPKVLILGGAGGVGTFTIQWAKHVLGAHVATTASERNTQLVKDLGADVVINYREEDFAEKLKGQDFDVVFDAAGEKDAYERASGVLSSKGAFVSITNGSQDGDVVGEQTRKFFLTDSSGADLARIAKAVEAGKVKPVMDKTFSVEESPAALLYSASGKARGKIVVDFVAPEKKAETMKALVFTEYSQELKGDTLKVVDVPRTYTR